MHLIVLYDISEDRIRTKIADVCQDYGLDRTQFSAFIGELSRTHQDELTLRLQTLLGDRPGALLIVPVNGPEWARRWELRNKPDGSDRMTPAVLPPGTDDSTLDPDTAAATPPQTMRPTRNLDEEPF